MSSNNAYYCTPRPSSSPLRRKTMTEYEIRFRLQRLKWLKREAKSLDMQRKNAAPLKRGFARSFPARGPATALERAPARAPCGRLPAASAIRAWISDGLATYYHKEKARSWLSHRIAGSDSPRAWVQLQATKNIRTNADVVNAPPGQVCRPLLPSAFERTRPQPWANGAGNPSPEKATAHS